MTAITSSGASETDSARKRAAGRRAGATLRITSTPPPPGMCTSSSTTSGSRPRSCATASSTVAASPHDRTSAVELAAHARAEQLVVVDDHDAGLAHRAPWSTSSTSVPAPGGLHDRRGPPWRSMRPTIDSRKPAPVLGDGGGSKPGPRSRTNTCGRARRRFGVDVHRRPAGELGGVHERLAGGATSASPPSSSGASPTATTSIGTPWASSTSAAAASSALASGARRPRRAPPPAQPRRSSRSWRRARRGHRARVAGALLHERERLEHGVVQVRGHLGALLERMRSARSAVSPHEPQTTRGEDQRRARRRPRARPAARRARR